MTFRVKSDGTEAGTKVFYDTPIGCSELRGIVALKFEMGTAWGKSRLTIEVVGAELDITALPEDTVVIPLEGAQDVPEEAPASVRSLEWDVDQGPPF